MRRAFLFLTIGLLLCTACRPHTPALRSDFTAEEQAILDKSRALIGRAYFGSLVTHAGDKMMRVRVMEPFAPTDDWIIWLATNRHSRKVKEIERNPYVSLHYFDRSSPGYVSLYGRAQLVDDSLTKQKIWKKGWEKFYPGRQNYLLIRFEPERLEMIDVSGGLPGDSLTWAPYTVILRR